MSAVARNLYSSKRAPFLLIALLFSTVLSCGLLDKPESRSPLKKVTKQKIFYAPYEQVWRSAQAVLRYPISIQNEETGIIETDYVRGVDGWLPPEQTKPPSSGLRYKLILTFAKGKVDGRESTRLTIDKKVEVLRDFFSEAQPLESDGLEESVLFYRIERELIIYETLKKVSS